MLFSTLVIKSKKRVKKAKRIKYLEWDLDSGVVVLPDQRLATQSLLLWLWDLEYEYRESGAVMNKYYLPIEAGVNCSRQDQESRLGTRGATLR